jgi:hypothetical protein
MNALGALVVIALFILLLQSGEFPLVLFATLLVLGLVDEKRLAALARNLGKIYYKVKVETASLLGLDKELLNDLDLLKTLKLGLGNIGEWRASKISAKTVTRDKSSELLRIYETLKDKGS